MLQTPCKPDDTLLELRKGPAWLLFHGTYTKTAIGWRDIFMTINLPVHIRDVATGVWLNAPFSGLTIKGRGRTGKTSYKEEVCRHCPWRVCSSYTLVIPKMSAGMFEANMHRTSVNFVCR